MEKEENPLVLHLDIAFVILQVRTLWVEDEFHLMVPAGR